MATIATICARGGSKGLPGKNMRSFADKPLLAHSIEQALACPQVDGVYVSTDDDAIAEIALHYGASVPYLRPAEMATDSAPKIPAIEHLVCHLEARGLVVDRIVDLQPTSPLRTQRDLAEALAISQGCDLVVSVCEVSHSPYFTAVELTTDGCLELSKPTGHVRRQDLPQVWGLNGSIYVWQRAALRRAAKEGLWSVRVCPSIMPRERSIDIDDQLDFDMAQWLWHRIHSQEAAYE